MLSSTSLESPHGRLSQLFQLKFRGANQQNWDCRLMPDF